MSNSQFHVNNNYYGGQVSVTPLREVMESVLEMRMCLDVNQLIHVDRALPVSVLLNYYRLINNDSVIIAKVATSIGRAMQ